MKMECKEDRYSGDWDFEIKPYGINVAQTWRQVVAFLSMVTTYRVALFVEIGVYLGGVGTFLFPRCMYISNFSYLGVENDRKVVNPKHVEVLSSVPNAELLYGDCFDPAVLLYISEKVRLTEGVAMILCDGDDKPKEMKTYSEFLRSGDIIIMHDYASHIHGNTIDDMFTDGYEKVEGGRYMKLAGLPSYRKL
jgi:cephalosporin hydroxylase